MSGDEFEANAILTFVDEEGHEWLAAANIGPLTKFCDSVPEEYLDLQALKDRAFALTSFKVIRK